MILNGLSPNIRHVPHHAHTVLHVCSTPQWAHSVYQYNTYIALYSLIGHYIALYNVKCINLLKNKCRLVDRGKTQATAQLTVNGIT